MKPLRRQRLSGITTLASFEFLGALSCIGLLFFTLPGSRDFMALSIGAVLGFVVVYSLCTLQFWAFWFTAVYESTEIVYELFPADTTRISKPAHARESSRHSFERHDARLHLP